MENVTNKFGDLSDLEHQEGPVPCVCGRHRSQREHDDEARHLLAHRLLQCEGVAPGPRHFDGLLAREAMRVNFPKG